MIELSALSLVEAYADKGLVGDSSLRIPSVYLAVGILDSPYSNPSESDGFLAELRK
jgi:hypothetical protein